VRGQHTPNKYYFAARDHVVGERYDGGTAGAIGEPSYSTTTAIDPATGKVQWQTKVDEAGLGSPICGGSVATGGDLVFYGGRDGYFNAVDARTGQVLWRYQTGSWVRSTPITYRVGGHQFVAVTTLKELLTFALPIDR
jgi:alcohol dehydrogenase (cytochrome c)